MQISKKATTKKAPQKLYLHYLSGVCGPAVCAVGFCFLQKKATLLCDSRHFLGRALEPSISRCSCVHQPTTVEVLRLVTLKSLLFFAPLLHFSLFVFFFFCHFRGWVITSSTFNYAALSISEGKKTRATVPKPTPQTTVATTKKGKRNNIYRRRIERSNTWPRPHRIMGKLFYGPSSGCKKMKEGSKDFPYGFDTVGHSLRDGWAHVFVRSTR